MVISLTASIPIAIFSCPLVRAFKALYGDIAIFLLPETLLCIAFIPIATLPSAVVALFKVPEPNAVLLSPVVIYLSAVLPKAILFLASSVVDEGSLPK